MLDNTPAKPGSLELQLLRSLRERAGKFKALGLPNEFRPSQDNSVCTH